MNIRTWDREIAGLALCGGCDILRRSAAFCQGGAIGTGSRLAVSFVGVGTGVTEARMSERKGAGAQRKRCLTQWSLDSRLRGNDVMGCGSGVMCGGNEVM